MKMESGTWLQCYCLLSLLTFSALMEIQPPPIKMTPSPTVSSTVIISPESLSHHSSPAKTSRIYFQSTSMQPPPHMVQHEIVDETMNTRMPLSISSHQQLTAAGISTPVDHPHSSISALSGLHSDVSWTISYEYRQRTAQYFNVEIVLSSFSMGHIRANSKFARARSPHKHHRQPAAII